MGSQVPLARQLDGHPPPAFSWSSLQRPASRRGRLPWAVPYERAGCLLRNVATRVHGKVAVGATNVGSIVADFDLNLKTNQRGKMPEYKHEVEYEEPIIFKKGDDFGFFNFGSTMVVIFEAPSDLGLRPSENVKMGEPLLL